MAGATTGDGKPAGAGKHSAGVLLYRMDADGLRVLIAHPGGPLWARKDLGAWTIPKGLPEPGEALVDAARREFEEETGTPLPTGELIGLGEIRQAGGKVVSGFAISGDLDVTAVVSNVFEMMWPPRSGRMQQFPEVDRVEWVTPAVARDKLNPAQAAFVDRLEDLLAPA